MPRWGVSTSLIVFESAFIIIAAVDAATAQCTAHRCCRRKAYIYLYVAYNKAIEILSATNVIDEIDMEIRKK